jgi:hypothetical protein
MYASMTTFVDRLDRMQTQPGSLLSWGCPVPFFGDLSSARFATVGINPSNREFMDVRGRELQGDQRRLPTLRSLGLTRWGEANALHLREILEACALYFHRNPYDRWFGVLEHVFEPSGLSFYGRNPSACHIDLVPFATRTKWTLLPGDERRRLLASTSDALGLLLRDSNVEVLMLNGRSVVDHFELLTNVQLDCSAMESWNLRRGDSPTVRGFAYAGIVHQVGGVPLRRRLRVYGYNHNLQSSFGISRRVVSSIGRWFESIYVPAAA